MSITPIEVKNINYIVFLEIDPLSKDFYSILMSELSDMFIDECNVIKRK